MGESRSLIRSQPVLAIEGRRMQYLLGLTVCVFPQQGRLYIRLPVYPVCFATRSLSGLGVAARALGDATLLRVM
jgi:hypothetical protein